MKKERDPHFLVAANADQVKFREKDFPEPLLSSSIGSLYEEKNQCVFCKAYRFEGERNFCCGKGKFKIESLPQAPKEKQTLYSEGKFLKDARAYNNILAMASVGCATPCSRSEVTLTLKTELLLLNKRTLLLVEL